VSGAKTVGLTVDGLAVRVAEGTNVLQAAAAAGIDIPHFCYHPAFEAVGGCRMCLVEIEGLPKLELSCSTAVREGMVVRTATARVREARRDVLEFLLAEHPLDCPVCDKAGECRLQDYYDAHGRFPGRFLEAKEKREKLVPIGRGLVLDRERCILCTRCVRFLRRVTGTGELGVFERGVRSEIGIYEESRIDNGYAGNLVDLCPVGAITDTDFRFRTRTWFLERRPSVCPRCGRGCAVVVESLSGHPLGPGERRVLRVRAAENPAVNGWWMCDLGRAGRRDADEGRARSADALFDWREAVAEIAARLRAAADPDRIAVVLHSALTCEELVLARRIFVEGLKLSGVFFADPGPAAADGPLLTAERVPNARGVREAGFAPRLPDLERLSRSTDVLLVFGPHLAGHFPAEALARALDPIAAKFVITSHAGVLDGMAGLVVPVAVPYEKSGTYINIAGLRQTFAKAVEPARGVPSERLVLACLAGGLGLSTGETDVR
jgi:NADH-quinone oxidoreductase subunit G